jgi:hypothetical protein
MRLKGRAAALALPALVLLSSFCAACGAGDTGGTDLRDGSSRSDVPEPADARDAALGSDVARPSDAGADASYDAGRDAATPDGGPSNPLAAAGVPPVVAALALTAYTNGRAQNLTQSPVFTVIDFSQPSYHRRLWTVDMDHGTLLVNDRVAHGSGSGSANDDAMADSFSNIPGSNQSSLGLCLTAETYDGSNGYSLRLDGQEDSNSNMRDRAIVVHGAWYCEDDFVDQNGYLGRSSGCPAVAASRSADFIDVIKDGTLMWAYYPDQEWLDSSPFLQ